MKTLVNYESEDKWGAKSHAPPKAISNDTIDDFGG